MTWMNIYSDVTSSSQCRMLQDDVTLTKLVGEYCTLFGCDFDEIMRKPFIKLTPRSHRPYGNLYAK